MIGEWCCWAFIRLYWRPLVVKTPFPFPSAFAKIRLIRGQNSRRIPLRETFSNPAISDIPTKIDLLSLN